MRKLVVDSIRLTLCLLDYATNQLRFYNRDNYYKLLTLEIVKCVLKKVNEMRRYFELFYFFNVVCPIKVNINVNRFFCKNVTQNLTIL